jgi:hypothetical protein
VTEKYRQPWRIYLSGEPWRVAETGEISVRALAEEPVDKSGREMNAKIPECAAPSCTFTEASRPKEVKALLNFGRDSDWPLRVTHASSLDGENSISVTYPIEWEGCVSKVERFLAKFSEAAMRDGLQPLPVATREGVSWLSVLRKEDNAIRVILYEKGADEAVVPTPDGTGIPPMLLYGPNVEIKMRCTGHFTEGKCR